MGTTIDSGPVLAGNWQLAALNLKAAARGALLHRSMITGPPITGFSVSPDRYTQCLAFKAGIGPSDSAHPTQWRQTLVRS